MLCDVSREPDLLRKEVAVLKAGHAAMRVASHTLRGRVRTLEERVAKDCHKSHQPPPSEGLSKPKPESLRQKSDRTTDDRPGHRGHTLCLVEKADRIVPHRVERCAGCGGSSAGQRPNRVERRPVHDLPEPQVEVTEHQAEVKT
jgi:transposase